jgi:hypothetical protein
MLRRFLIVLVIGFAASLHAQGEGPPPALYGKIATGTYLAPGGAYKISIPVLPELGGVVTDTENVVTFQDDFTTHVSIAAFPQDATQRWELATRGAKEYLIYFFSNFVMPDFQQRFEGARIESAVFLPTLQDGALLTYTLLPGGSMFAERATLSDTPDRTLVAKRGNLLFVKNGRIFVISTELAERVMERVNYKKTTAEEDKLLREHLLDLLSKIQFPKPAADLGKK